MLLFRGAVGTEPSAQSLPLLTRLPLVPRRPDYAILSGHVGRLGTHPGRARVRGVRGRSRMGTPSMSYYFRHSLSLKVKMIITTITYYYYYYVAEFPCRRARTLGLRGHPVLLHVPPNALLRSPGPLFSLPPLPRSLRPSRSLLGSSPLHLFPILLRAIVGTLQLGRASWARRSGP